jgi:integrase
MVNPKGNKSEKKPRHINADALEVLKTYIRFKYEHLRSTMSEQKWRELYVFSTNDGETPISTDLIRDTFGRLIKKGIRDGIIKKGIKYTPHSLRHTYAMLS